MRKSPTLNRTIMDERDIRSLIALNKDFYKANAESFSRSRQGSWPGWNRLVGLLDDHMASETVSVLDVACGNCRFENYLAQSMPEKRFQFTCVDSSSAFASSADGVRFVKDDVLGRLMTTSSVFDAGKQFDVVVSFGFMHHIPTALLRQRFLSALVSCAKPGGLIAVSFWRFMDDRSLAQKARETTEAKREQLAIQLEDHDYYLGWDGSADYLRYCHHFTDDQIERLAQAVSSQADVEARYCADGRTRRLNGYLVFRRV